MLSCRANIGGEGSRGSWMKMCIVNSVSIKQTFTIDRNTCFCFALTCCPRGNNLVTCGNMFGIQKDGYPPNNLVYKSTLLYSLLATLFALLLFLGLLLRNSILYESILFRRRWGHLVSFDAFLCLVATFLL